MRWCATMPRGWRGFTTGRRGRPPRRLDAAGGGRARSWRAIERGPDLPTRTAVAPGGGPTSAAGWRPSFGKTYHPSSMSQGASRRLGFSRETGAAPSPSAKKDPEARGRPSKRGARRPGWPNRGHRPSRQADRAVVRRRGPGRQQGPGRATAGGAAGRAPAGRRSNSATCWATISTAIRPATGRGRHAGAAGREHRRECRVFLDHVAASRPPSPTRSSGKLSPGQRPILLAPLVAPLRRRLAREPHPRRAAQHHPRSSCRPPIKPGAGSTAPRTRWSASGSTCASASSRCASFAQPDAIIGACSPRLDAPRSLSPIGSGPLAARPWIEKVAS